MEYTITSAIEFLKMIKSQKIVQIKFKKKDGSDRIMRCTLDFSIIPKKDRPSTLNLEKIIKLMYVNHILKVFDVENEGWRSIDFTSVEYLSADGKMYKVVLK